MEKLKSFVRQNLKLILFALFGLLVVTGILVIVLGGGNSDGFLKVMFIIFGIVLELLACSVAFLAIVMGESEPANFFLYDGKKGANISLDELDFARVDKKMTFVMTNLTESVSEVWSRRVIFAQSSDVLRENEALVPLVAYKMLYDLAERANENVWGNYLSADALVIEDVAAALELNGDTELGNAFKFLFENAAGSYERTAKFLADNKRYIQSKMLKYVKANIERF
ncbi:MAG: hypothetical protein IKL66_02015 [Clostridia bacterium]|nr:hypothetical protein [Clostridia bacterium]